MTTSNTRNIFFIDAEVINSQLLIDSLPKDSIYFVLDRNQDGLTQINDALTHYQNLDSIQRLSHGSDTTLHLGNTVLNNASLDANKEILQSIGSHLNPSGDILLYGCNVAQTEDGKQFIETLSHITGADVAASTNLTGNNQLGVDWKLET